MPARSSTTSCGQERRPILPAISSATLLQPLYLRACTMDDAGSTGIQQTDLTARTNGGSKAHH